MANDLNPMEKCIVGLLSAAAISIASASAAELSNAVKGQKEEAMTRQRVEDWAKAVHARDIDRVLSLCTTNIVSFDLDPPLRYAGADNKRLH